MPSTLQKLRQSTSTDFFTSNTLKTLHPTVDAQKSWVRRALAKNEIVRIKKGLYIFSADYRRTNPHPFEISHLIYGSSYVSFESALSFHGLIPEAVTTITSANQKRNCVFKTPIGVFKYTSVSTNYFFEGVVRYETKHKGAYLVASPEKALCDLIYARNLRWEGLELLTEGYRIDEQALNQLDLQFALKISRSFRSKKISEFLTNLKKAI